MNTTIIIVLGFLILIVVAAIVVVLAKGKDPNKKGATGEMTFKEVDEQKPEDVKPPEKFSPQLHPKNSPPSQEKGTLTPVTESKPPIQETISSNPTITTSSENMPKRPPIDNLSKPLKQTPPLQTEPENTQTQQVVNKPNVAHPIDSLSPSLSQIEKEETFPISPATQPTNPPDAPKTIPATPVAPNTPITQTKPVTPTTPSTPIRPTQGEVFKPNPLPSQDKIQSDMNNLNTATNEPVNKNPQFEPSIGNDGVQDIENSINGTPGIPNFPSSPDSIGNTPVNPPASQQPPSMDSNINQESPVQPPPTPQTPPQQQNPVKFP